MAASSTIGRGVQYVDHNGQAAPRPPANVATNDTVRSAQLGDSDRVTHFRGVHRCRNETDDKPITREEYRRREGV